MCTCKYNIATPGRCSKCGAELVEQSVLVGERSYCVGCFVCGQCGATLAGKYYELEGVVSCQQCRYQRIFHHLRMVIRTTKPKPLSYCRTHY